MTEPAGMLAGYQKMQGGESMSTKDVYEELAEMEDRDDVVGMPMTPEFLKLLRLQFTPREARLAVQKRQAWRNRN